MIRWNISIWFALRNLLLKWKNILYQVRSRPRESSLCNPSIFVICWALGRDFQCVSIAWHSRCHDRWQSASMNRRPTAETVSTWKCGVHPIHQARLQRVALLVSCTDPVGPALSTSTTRVIFMFQLYQKCNKMFQIIIQSQAFLVGLPVNHDRLNEAIL